MTTRFEKLGKIAVIIQALALTVATIIGGFWAYHRYFMAGENVSGCEITIKTKQLKSSESKHHLLAIEVEIKGSDRKGYHYDFRKAFLSACRVSFDPEGKQIYEPVANNAINQPIVSQKGELGFMQTQRSHISSYRTTMYPFLLSFEKPGIYLLTFYMPHKGVIEDPSVDMVDMTGVDPKNVIGIFVGEMKSKYVVID